MAQIEPQTSLTAPLRSPEAVDRALLLATLAFSLAALGYLVARCIERPAAATEAALVFAVTLVVSAASSCLYNLARAAPRRDALRCLDHCAIFLLIAGTCTPFASGVGQWLGAGSVWPVWLLSLAGIALKLLLRGRYERCFVGFYLLIGWFGLLSLQGLMATIPLSALLLLALGGLSYTGGAVIYALDRSRWTAAAWHGCVLSGGVSHALAVMANLAAN